jgi:hypothetical protein
MDRWTIHYRLPMGKWQHVICDDKTQAEATCDELERQGAEIHVTLAEDSGARKPHKPRRRRRRTIRRWATIYFVEGGGLDDGRRYVYFHHPTDLAFRFVMSFFLGMLVCFVCFTIWGGARFIDKQKGDFPNTQQTEETAKT